ncbi:MAG TPA: hypothetical protein VGN42_16550 [Pirellulales bacterium]|nr:hypothetical protein [Pirellulales bacterium]
MNIGLDRARGDSRQPLQFPGREASAAANRFRHQIYADGPAAPVYHRLKPLPGPTLASGEVRFRMRQIGETLRAANVAAIYLVQGAFAALDASCVVAEFGRRHPTNRPAIERVARQMLDPAAADAGNFTPRYADALESLLAGGGTPIPVRMLQWSGENHHLGRADAAVRLIDELASLELAPHRRVLIWGHGHAGNVFALASNLLSGDSAAIQEFFAAAAIYYRLPLTGVVDVPVWQRVRGTLLDEPRRLAGRPLDFVTFGTPIRYGWDRRGYDGLLHFVNHRPVNGLPPHRAALPSRIGDIMQASGGDYLQHIGVAGSDSAPSRFAWRAWLADRKLQQLLERDLCPSDLIERLQLGNRVADSGVTLLVDYGPPSANPAQHLAGHAVYTRGEWLLFHAEEIAQRLYGSAASGAIAA